MCIPADASIKLKGIMEGDRKVGKSDHNTLKCNASMDHMGRTFSGSLNVLTSVNVLCANEKVHPSE